MRRILRAARALFSLWSFPRARPDDGRNRRPSRRRAGRGAARRHGRGARPRAAGLAFGGDRRDGRLPPRADAARDLHGHGDAGGVRDPQRTVVVALAKTSTELITLGPSAKAEILVTGETPVVDTTSTEVGSNFDDRQIKTLPTGRNYSSVVLVAPGVTNQASNTAASPTRSRSTAPPASRTASSSTAPTRAASSTARRARSSTSSSSRRSTSRPAATRPSTAARRAASSTSSRSRAATSSTATSSATTTPTRSRPTTATPTRTSTGRTRGSRRYDWGLDAGGYL